SVELPVGKPDSMLVIHKPDGNESRPSTGAKSFAQTDQPGIYEMGSGAEQQRFAVNLSAAESNTAPLELEQLEQLGVKSGSALSKAERLDRIRQQRDTELESRQKIWRWLVVGALGILILETFWAGRAARIITKAEGLA
ncbi:MAG TPA: hypothetical protein VKH44_02720, partial [Pirellulaceae bacterium]|nr:hypothetical protein [Pirellulaceae bacterium]